MHGSLSTSCPSDATGHTRTNILSSKASEYPDGLCKAICRGLARQKKYDVSGRSCSSVFDKGQLMNLVAGTKEIYKIEVDLDDKTFPAHWIDTKHEIDGADILHVGLRDWW